MQTRRSHAGERPVKLLTGPTLTLYRYNIAEETSESEDGTIKTSFGYDEIAFEPGEYETVRSGVVPDGGEWTDELRRIERSALLDDADRLIAEAQDNIAVSSGDAWTTYLQALRQYKMDVRATKDGTTFPQTVEYPELPVQP